MFKQSLYRVGVHRCLVGDEERSEVLQRVLMMKGMRLWAYCYCTALLHHHCQLLEQSVPIVLV